MKLSLDSSTLFSQGDFCYPCLTGERAETQRDTQLPQSHRVNKNPQCSEAQKELSMEAKRLGENPAGMMIQGVRQETRQGRDSKQLPKLPFHLD